MASPHLPHRIASLQPSATVILHAVGQLDCVVACTRYCRDVVADVADGSRIILADSWTANASQIVAAEPDLVIASVPYQEKAIVEILKAGVPFLGLAPKALEDVYTDIAMIAGIVGVHSRGEEIIRDMAQHIESVRRRSAGALRPRVFCEEWGKPLIASQKWVAELVEAAGGEFIGSPGKQIAPEVIADADPEVIIAAWCGAGDRVPLEKIVRERQWQLTSAARNCRILCVRDELLNTPAPTLMQGLDALAFAIHPELFPRTKGIRAITDVSASTVLNPAS
jgi:iron complex transport system substrate-binding protein